jgi:carboxyl-terminal processing protease
METGCIDSPATSSDPDLYVNEFELIWGLFDSEYIGFAVKGIDWDAVYTQYLPQAEQVSSREGMTALTTDMLGSLVDCYVWLLDPQYEKIGTYTPDIHMNFDMDVLMDYLEPWGFEWKQEDMWGFCFAGSDSIPYFVFCTWDDDFNISLFDNVLEPLLDRPGLIIDIRMNPGGSELPVNKVVRRYVDQLRTGHLTQQRLNSETHDLTDPVPVQLHPRSWYFGNHVLLLTGEYNTGASEQFICDMAVLPQVTLVGDTTLGASDWPEVYWPLPEEWSVTCPARTVLRPDTTYIEGVGIPPEIYVEATEDDFQSGIDPILEYAVNWF